MFETLTSIKQQIRDLAARIRQDLVPADQTVCLLQHVGEIENACAALRVLLSRRVAETSLWQKNGDRSAAQFVARTTRTTVSKAADTLETAKRLEGLPRTSDAFEAGQVSETQVREIASAASLSPSSEDELLEDGKNW